MNETETLRGLIGLARRERGTSVRQLAIQAKNAGFKIVGTTLNAIENGTYKSEPSEDTIRAIGWLAGVGEAVAFAAAGRRVPGPPFAEELPPGVDDLGPAERKAAIEMLRTLVALRQEVDNAQVQEPRTQEGSSKQRSAGSGEEGPGAAMKPGAKPRHLNAAPPAMPTAEQEAELARVREEFKDTVNPSEWTLNEQGRVVDRHGMPPFDEADLIAAHRTTDDLAGMYPAAVTPEDESQGEAPDGGA
ncbi:hypothetical protein P3H15_27490 [Rhodococcus sp. T2V]|uniref:hypothetical protein n=1 Tax=Rhodococcus sp. T2V TaxID=3034164 RepID=UPI0023E31780|nr:hypothetical protein [Rhodococcus sp. T2V]MDF3308767.1 hypothetical protein [Rhodococcus sp. T2V]